MPSSVSTQSKKNTIVIGLSGPAKSGKGEVADAIKERCVELGLKCIEINFADHLKNVVGLLMGIPLEVMNTQEGKASVYSDCYGLTVRKLLQITGADFVRNMIHPDFWMDKFKSKVNDAVQQGYDVIICQDCRFDNETDLLKKLGYVIRINPAYQDYKPIEGESHISERPSLIPADFYLQNDSSVSWLRVRARLLVDAIVSTHYEH